MKNKIYVTNLPSFCKLNLFNEVAKHLNLLVLFTDDASPLRNPDFFDGIRDFNNISLTGTNLISKIFN